MTVWADLTCAFLPSQWRAVITKLARTSKKQVIKNFIVLVPQAIIFYALLSPVVAMPLYNKMLFFPSKILAVDVSELQGVPKTDVWIPVSERKGSTFLHAWYFKKPQSLATVVINHGNAGNISHRIPLIQMLLSEQLSVLAYDYEGYGKSEGDPTIDHICQDGIAAFDYLCQKEGLQAGDIILYGESLGGGVACQIARERQCKALILQSTFASLPSIARRKMLLMKLYPSFLFPKNSMNNSDVLASKHPPLLIIHGELDNIIPIAESEALFERACQPKAMERLPLAGHNDVYVENRPALQKVIATFLQTLQQQEHH